MEIFTYNKNNNYLDKYKPLKYEQYITVPTSIKTTKSDIISKGYSSIEECILSVYDNTYMCESDIHDIYNKLLKYADNLVDNYEKYNYCKKTFPRKVIEHGLHSLHNLSTIIYLADIYNIELTLTINTINYKVSRKNVNTLHISYINNKYCIMDSLSTNKVQLLDTRDIPININIENLFISFNLLDIYNKHLSNISKYKLHELIDIASSRNISYLNGTKKKTKKELFNEINYSFQI